jgi:glycine oxidase
VATLIKYGSRCDGVKTMSGETFSAGHIGVAAGCWTSLIPEVAPYAPTQPVRGQMAALLHKGKPIRHVLRSERGYIVPRDQETPQKLVVGSTLENVGYEKAVTSGGLENIFSAVNEILPSLAGAEILETWSGLRPGTPDQLPILGPTEIEGLVMATGHYRNGILLAPVTAKLIAEWITERRVSLDWESFSPSRFGRGNMGQSATAQF